MVPLAPVAGDKSHPLARAKHSSFLLSLREGGDDDFGNSELLEAATNGLYAGRSP